MDTRVVQAFYGQGKGKTSAAVGQALREAGEGQHITVSQFLKGKVADEFKILARLEPDVQIFRFDQSESSYCDLSLQEKEEEKQKLLQQLVVIQRRFIKFVAVYINIKQICLILK